jgi:hypothetical protein
MNKITNILENLSTNTPFAINRFNDGELIGINRPGSVVARGAQAVNQELSSKLKEALQHQQKNYWIGIPCSVCFPDLHKLSLSLIDIMYPFLTHAVVLTNRNLKLFTEEFPKRVKGRSLIWVSGEDQDIKGLEKIGITIFNHIKVPTMNAWSAYDQVKNFDEFQPEDIVMCSCGPLSRILVREWFEKFPDITFIDIGSTFDPYTRNNKLRVHLGTLPACKECN